jgi:hypothetical protein
MGCVVSLKHPTIFFEDFIMLNRNDVVAAMNDTAVQYAQALVEYHQYKDCRDSEHASDRAGYRNAVDRMYSLQNHLNSLAVQVAEMDF